MKAVRRRWSLDPAVQVSCSTLPTNFPCIIHPQFRGWLPHNCGTVQQSLKEMKRRLTLAPSKQASPFPIPMT